MDFSLGFRRLKISALAVMRDYVPVLQEVPFPVVTSDISDAKKPG